MKKTTKIFGPPGTGKTTTLLNIVEEHLSKGVAPEQIAYLSFSKRAADEAVSRAYKKFKIEKDRFKYFRTLHSLGYFAQGLQIDASMKYEDYKVIADELGLEITKFNDEEDNNYGNKPGDNCMQIHRLARSRMISPRDEWANAEKQITIPWASVEQWIETVNAYKAKENKHDFEDMLEGYKGALPVKVFIVDEAQDLSKLQWHVVSQAIEKAEHIYFAGDDDQCIYGWNGAEVSIFLEYPADEEMVLPKSWRVPSELLPLSNNIARRITKRKEKEWQPVGSGGTIFRDMTLWDLKLEEGEWFILVRNTKFLDDVRRVLREKGLLWKDNKYKGRRSISIEDARLITNWEALRRGESITMGGANELIKKINVKMPLVSKREVFMADLPFTETFKKKPWYEIMERALTAKQLDYIRSCLRNGQKLMDEPRITISTIHKVKGGECDNVAIVPDYSYLSSQFMNSNSEHRVQYVGVTRAKKNLYLLNPITEYFYEY